MPVQRVPRYVMLLTALSGFIDADEQPRAHQVHSLFVFSCLTHSDCFIFSGKNSVMHSIYFLFSRTITCILENHRQALEVALPAVRDCADRINESMHQCERRRRVLHIARQFSDEDAQLMQLVVPGRVFVKQGDLKKVRARAQCQVDGNSG
jgi:hypothetical protein